MQVSTPHSIHHLLSSEARIEGSHEKEKEKKETSKQGRMWEVRCGD
jgi:hypothetical protein